MIKDALETTVSQDMQHFKLALILTDGISNDMQETLEVFTSCSEYPICFIVACLGPLRMETVHYFNVSACLDTFYFVPRWIMMFNEVIINSSWHR